MARRERHFLSLPTPHSDASYQSICDFAALHLFKESANGWVLIKAHANYACAHFESSEQSLGWNYYLCAG